MSTKPISEKEVRLEVRYLSGQFVSEVRKFCLLFRSFGYRI